MQNCLVCDGTGKVKRLGRNGLLDSPVLYCEGCRLGFTSAEGDAIRARLQEIYKSAYWRTAGNEGASRGLLTRGLYGTELSARLIHLVRSFGIPSSKVIAHHDIIQRCTAGRTLLEIGSGYGHALAYFKARQFEVRGIEPDEVNCARINERFGAGVCRSGDAETMKVDGQFDVIYLSHVFEHLVDPLGFLRKIRSNLRSGGIVLVEVPNCENEAVRKTSIMDSSHLYHFSTTCLSRLLQKADYRAIEVEVYRNRSRNRLGLLLRQVLRRNDYERAAPDVGDRIVLVGQPC
jgi:SAM-dependent methyltransferase